MIGRCERRTLTALQSPGGEYTILLSVSSMVMLDAASTGRTTVGRMKRKKSRRVLVQVPDRKGENKP